MAVPAEVSKKCSNFRIRQFKEKGYLKIATNLTLNTMVSFIILLMARTARIACADRQTDIQTHTHTRDNYCNPLCAACQGLIMNCSRERILASSSDCLASFWVICFSNSLLLSSVRLDPELSFYFSSFSLCITFSFFFRASSLPNTLLTMDLFLTFLAQFANLRVSSVSYSSAGVTAHMMAVLALSLSDGFKIRVNLESWYGIWPLVLPSESFEMTCLRVKRLRLMDFPSFTLLPTAPEVLSLSKPARSTRLSEETWTVPSHPFTLLSTPIPSTACERLLRSFILILPVVHLMLPMQMTLDTSSMLVTMYSLGYYHRFISKKYAETAAPLTDPTRKDAPKTG